jgi:hypothetical protein
MIPEIPIELRCPQCSAPVTLEESDRIMSCAFCRVRLCLSFQGAAKYCLTTPDLVAEDLFYVPYWRFRGMAFSVRGLEIQHRVADNSLLAITGCGLPPTLGFRPQALKLKPRVPGKGNRFLKPQQSFEQVRKSTNGSLWGIDDSEVGLQHLRTYEALIGETVHLVYSPVVPVDDGLWDPIVRRPLPGTNTGALSQALMDEAPSESIQFLPMICPKCGWDLAGEKDTLVPVCRNCHTLWDSGKGRLNQLSFGVDARGSNKGDIYLPFWRIQATTPDIQLQTKTDLIRLANVPKVIRKQEDEPNLEYYVSAFKVHPQLFLRLARGLTLCQPDTDLIEELPKAPLHPVTLPLEEALETLPILVGSLAVPKKAYLPMLPNLRFKQASTQLVFFPFELKGGELIQPDTGMSVHRNSLCMGRLI